MKRISLLVICVQCVMFTACDLDSIIDEYTPPVVDCSWDRCNTALFSDVYLFAPCSDGKCDYEFQNTALNNVMDCGSMIPLFESTQLGLLGPATCHFTWVVTVIPDQLCDTSPQAQTISLTQANYNPRLYIYGAGCDALRESPCNSGIQLLDHKHELTIQLSNVVNWSDGSEGTIIWKMVWERPTILPNAELLFTFPNQGLVGDYTPINNYYAPRRIYINGYYDDI